MRYKSKIVFCFLIFCLIINALYTHKMPEVLAAGSSKTRIRLKIDNQDVSGKTISIKKGKKKKIKIIVPKKKNYKIIFRSNKDSIAAVSKTGNIMAKEIGTAKVAVIVKSKKKRYQSWIRIKVVSANKTTEQTESSVEDTNTVSDMYEITIQVGENVFPAKLYQTETTKSILQKLPLSITMDELNGNEKYYYFSENFPTESQKVSKIHAGDLKLYGSSCLVLFYESFSTSYRYTSLGYVENPEGLAEALGTDSVRVDIFSSEEKMGE